jgi:hypothetical protein
LILRVAFAETTALVCSINHIIQQSNDLSAISKDLVSGIRSLLYEDDHPAGESILMDQVQNTGHSKAKRPIHDNEKQARKQDHEDNERSRDQRFAPRRPGYLASLGTDFLQEFGGVRHCVNMLERLDITLERLDIAPAGALQIAPPANRRIDDRPEPIRARSRKNRGAEPGGHAPGQHFIAKPAAKVNLFLTGPNATRRPQCGPIMIGACECCGKAFIPRH